MAGAIEIWEQKGNVHVDLEASRPRPRHYYLADLAARHGGDGAYLDIGCGPGLLLELIQKRRPAASFSIADAYPACLDIAERRLGGVQARYLLDETRFEPDKVIDRTFDTILLSHVLEHLRNPIDGIESMMSLLKPGGKLILAVPNVARPDVVIRAMMRNHYVNRGHAFGWDRSHWKNFLERICDLDVIEYGADVVQLLPGPPGRAIARVGGRALAKAFPWWAFSNIAVVRKPT